MALGRQIIKTRRTLVANLPPAPGSLAVGELALELASDPIKFWVGVPDTIDATQRKQITTGGQVIISATDPAPVTPGTLWWDSVSGQLFIRFDDGTSTQWVSASSGAGITDGDGGGGIEDAPDTAGVLYGRREGTWLPVLPITGGTLNGALVAAGLTSSAGLSVAQAATFGDNLSVAGTLSAAGLSSFYNGLNVGARSGPGTDAIRATTGNFRTDAGQIIAGGDPAPAFCCYNPVQNTAMGMWLGAYNYLYFGTMNSDGGFGWSVANMQQDGTLAINGPAWKPGGGAWNDSSDARIKKVAGDFTRGLAAIMQLKPKNVVYLGNETIGGPPAEGDTVPYHDSGHYLAAQAETEFTTLVAQDVETVFPEMVERRTGYIDGKQVDDLRILNTTPLIYALINAVKELSTEVEDLRTRLVAK